MEPTPCWKRWDCRFFLAEVFERPEKRPGTPSAGVGMTAFFYPIPSGALPGGRFLPRSGLRRDGPTGLREGSTARSRERMCERAPDSSGLELPIALIAGGLRGRWCPGFSSRRATRGRVAQLDRLEPGIPRVVAEAWGCARAPGGRGSVPALGEPVPLPRRRVHPPAGRRTLPRIGSARVPSGARGLREFESGLHDRPGGPVLGLGEGTLRSEAAQPGRLSRAPRPLRGLDPARGIPQGLAAGSMPPRRARQPVRDPLAERRHGNGLRRLRGGAAGAIGRLTPARTKRGRTFVVRPGPPGSCCDRAARRVPVCPRGARARGGRRSRSVAEPTGQPSRVG